MRLLLFIVIPIILLGLIGCSKHPDHVPVTVQINDKGTPVEGVSITFTAEDGSYAVGITDATGIAPMYTYEPEDGVKKGSYLVELIKYEKVPLPGENIDLDAQIAAADPIPVSLIPEKYTSTKTSGLSVVVEKEIPMLVFDIGE